MSVALISLYDHFSEGNRSIHGVLNRDGIESDLIFFHSLDFIVHPPSPESFDALANLLANLKPELVGISIRSQFWWMAVKIARRVKEELGVPVVFGGVHPTLDPEESIEVADIVCQGEGEAAMPELVRRLRQGKPIHDIPGLWSRKNGEIVRNGPTIAVENLDDLPLPVTDRSYSITMKGEARRFDMLFDNDSQYYYIVSASRGCPFSCSYCCNTTLKSLLDKKENYLRRRSVKHLFEEFHFVLEKLPNVKVINFLDEVFHPPKQWMDEFVERYPKEVGRPFSLMTHPGYINEQWIETLMKAGIGLMLNFGLQSGNERVRKEVFNRHVSDKKVDELIELMNRYSFLKLVDIIVDNPFETPEEFRDTALTVFRLRRPVVLNVYFLMYFPGLAITDRAIEEGYITKKDMPGYTEDWIELWIPALEDPQGSHLKTYLKVLIHLHQLKMRSIFRPWRDYKPVPLWLLKLLARKKNVTHRHAKFAIKTHDFLVKTAIITFKLGGLMQVSYVLLGSFKIREFIRRLAKFLFRKKGVFKRSEKGT